GTLMVGDPAFTVQEMMLAQSQTLLGKSQKPVEIQVVAEPKLSSQVEQPVVEVGAHGKDDLVATGLDGTATVDLTLYGPLAPIDGSCDGLDWTGAPVRSVFPPSVVRNGDTLIASSGVLDTPGCYSFGAVLTPMSGSPVTMPPGIPSETL